MASSRPLSHDIARQMATITVFLGIFFYWNSYQLYNPELGEQVFVLDQARTAASDSDTPPPASAFQSSTSLPENWSLSRRDFEGRVWYRFNFTASATQQPWALYLPRVSQNAAVYINGVYIGSGGKMSRPFTINTRRPLLFEFNPTLLQASDNTIDIAVAGYANSDAGLNPPYIGPSSLIKSHFEYHHFSMVTLRFAAFVVIFLMTIFSGWLWILRRQDPVYRKFFIVCLIGSAWIFVTHSTYPLPPFLVNWSRLVFPCWFTFGVFLLANRLVDRPKQKDETAFFIYIILGGILLLLVPPAQQLRILGIWVIGTALLGIWIVYILWKGSNNSERASVSSLLIVMSIGYVLGLHDIALLLLKKAHVAPYIFHFAPILLSMVLGAEITARFMQSLDSSEKLNRELHALVEEKRSELELSYRQLAQLERKQAVYRERERIMRDLHDGLGGHLMTALAHSEMEHSNAQVREAIAQALNELRLMIDSVDIDPEHFCTLLGSMRDRIEPLLESTGGCFKWNMASEPDMKHMDRSQILHVLRIIQECFTNILRHSGAREIHVTTTRNRISIIDDGKGFSTEKPSSGRGLVNMRQRAHAAGVDLHIASSPQGTGIFIDLKKPSSQQVTV